jgi:hypothetical protein
MPRLSRPAHLWPALCLTILTTVALLAAGLLLSGPRPVAGRPAVAPPAAPHASASPTPICGPAWTIVPSPNNGSGYNALSSVAQVSANDSWAVGSYQTSGASYPLALHWDGTSWSSIPITSTGASSSLLGVAATAAGDVWAVGTRDGSTLIQHWDGATWSIVASPDGGPNGNFLWGVTALAANNAWAVGVSFDSNNAQHPLIEHWDGTVWTIVASPSAGNGSSLIGVTAITATDIWAVGSYVDGGGQDQAFSVHWDGTTWTSIPVVTGAQSASLRGVSGTSGSDVWAVGSNQMTTGGPSVALLVHWNGTTWDPFPNFIATTASNLQAVSAAGSSDVWAVGSISNGTTFQPLIVHWDGTSLTIEASPSLGSGKNHLNGVAVVGAGVVWAVGTGDGNRTLVERRSLQCMTPLPTATATPACSTGWAAISSPNVLTGSNTLNGVAALGAAEVWAVGSHSNTAHTLTLRWNGAYWLVIPSPDGGSGTNELLAVGGLSSTDAWAVGYTSNPQPETLVLHWDGAAWTRVASPNSGALGSRLFAVDPRAANDVWAVGSTVAPTGDEQTLIEHWDGLAWTVVASPNGDPEGSFLRGVTSLAADDAWAVGYTVHHDAPTPTATPLTLAGGQPAARGEHPLHGFEALLEHWDGTAWTLVDGPDLGVEDSHFLLGVAAASADDIWAVGYVGDTVQTTLTLHWDGIEWTVVPSPNAGTVSDNLRAVTVVGPNDVWAAGSTINGAGIKQTLLLHWNGTAWILVLPPNVNSGNNVFYGISGAAPNDLWAVGFSSAAGVNTTQTLTEHYSGPCATPGPTGTPTPTASPTATVCPITFNDVAPGSTGYDVIRCLACRGVISGYPCGGPGEPCPGAYYRVGNNVTRGQAAKIVAGSAGFSDPVPSTQQTYEDVPPGSTFHLWIERLSSRGIIAGYPCGGPFEPCVGPANRPYFRPNNPVTRGQLAKISANAAGYTETPAGQTFEDVPPTGTFYLYVERLVNRGIMSGYPCGGVGEPCVAPGNRPYFRPNGTATRGQTAKIVANTFYPNCQTPATRR